MKNENGIPDFFVFFEYKQQQNNNMKYDLFYPHPSSQEVMIIISKGPTSGTAPPHWIANHAQQCWTLSIHAEPEPRSLFYAAERVIGRGIIPEIFSWKIVFVKSYCGIKK